MRKRILAVLLVLVLCCGCGWEDPYRVDTVVWIPVDPTESPTETGQTQEPEAEAVTETTESAQMSEPTEAPRETTGKAGTSNKKPSSNKNNSASKNDKPRETEPPATKPAETTPPAARPPVTEPAATQPPMTQPPAAEPTGTEPTEAVPTEAGPPETHPAATEPPATEPEKLLYDISGYSLGALAYGICDEINALRTGAGLEPLSLDARISAIASCRGYEIAQSWSHTRPDGRDYATVLSDYGCGAGAVAELLTYGPGSGDPAAMVAKWASSDSHLQNMLGNGWRTLGVGTYEADGCTYVCVLLLG